MPVNPSFQEHQQAWPWMEAAAVYHPSTHYYHCEREQLFEKTLTPSDVGKLNRLVIPKQHAERHFPLSGDAAERGLLLTFEDEAGRPWRFRYSYWSSSQSYVLTKGWSRFVKEKHVEAGDVVFFERTRRGHSDCYGIGCRRQGDAPESTPPPPSQPPYSSCHPFLSRHDHHLHYAGDQFQSDNIAPPTNIPAVPAANYKRLRLFGVNLDCGPPLQVHPEQDMVKSVNSS